MIEDDHEERLQRGASVFAVAPVARRRSLPLLLVVAAMVGVVAFAGGLLAASSPSDRSIQLGRALPAPSRGPAQTPPPATPTDPAPTQPSPPSPRPTALPGSSGFVAGFDPAQVLATVEGGQQCTVGQPLQVEAPRTRLDGPRLTFQRSWLVDCTLPAADRQAFLVRLFNALVPRIPADTFSYGTAIDGSGTALYPFAERPLAGTVSVHAGSAGDRLAIVLLVEEWQVG